VLKNLSLEDDLMLLWIVL